MGIVPPEAQQSSPAQFVIETWIDWPHKQRGCQARIALREIFCVKFDFCYNDSIDTHTKSLLDLCILLHFSITSITSCLRTNSSTISQNIKE